LCCGSCVIWQKPRNQKVWPFWFSRWDETTMLSQNVRYQAAHDIMSYRRKTEALAKLVLVTLPWRWSQPIALKCLQTISLQHGVTG
jgi:hypothetical protein